MIIFLYGQDSYRAKQKLDEIIAKEKKTSGKGLILDYLEDQSLSVENLKKNLSNLSMFGEKNLIVLRGVFSDKSFGGEFLKCADDFLKKEDLILIFEDGEIDKRDSLFKFLKQNAKCQEFEKLERQDIIEWTEKEFLKYGEKIDSEVCQKLVFYVGNDLWQMGNEIKKIVNYAKGRKISRTDVDLLVRPKIENDIFKTIDAMVEGKKDEAFWFLHKHLQAGDSPLYLFSMINFQFRNLLEIKDLMEKKISLNGIFTKSSLHPFVIKKTYWQAQKFSFVQLKKIYQKILSADLSIKTGKIEPEGALDMFVSGV
jgi:DNA polymerase III subunit delta